MAGFDKRTLLANFIQLNCSRCAPTLRRSHFNASEIIAIDNVIHSTLRGSDLSSAQALSSSNSSENLR